MNEQEIKLVRPAFIVLILLSAIFLAMLHVINVLWLGLIGVVCMSMLLIEPYLREFGLLKTQDEEFAYRLLVIFSGLLIFGLLQAGVIPIISATGILALDIVLTTVILLFVVIVVFLSLYLYTHKEELEKIKKRL